MTEEREIERLRRLIAWCRPRLSKDVYRTSLDEQLANPREPCDAKVIRSIGVPGKPYDKPPTVVIIHDVNSGRRPIGML